VPPPPLDTLRRSRPHRTAAHPASSEEAREEAGPDRRAVFPSSPNGWSRAAHLEKGENPLGPASIGGIRSAGRIVFQPAKLPIAVNRHMGTKGGGPGSPAS